MNNQQLNDFENRCKKSWNWEIEAVYISCIWRSYTVLNSMNFSHLVCVCYKFCLQLFCCPFQNPKDGKLYSSAEISLHARDRPTAAADAAAIDNVWCGFTSASAHAAEWLTVIVSGGSCHAPVHGAYYRRIITSHRLAWVTLHRSRHKMAWIIRPLAIFILLPWDMHSRHVML